MLFDASLRPAYSSARVNRALVTNGRIDTRQGCMGLSRIHDEYPYRRYEQQNQGFMTGLKSFSVQTIYFTAVNVLSKAKVPFHPAKYPCLAAAFFQRVLQTPPYQQEQSLTEVLQFQRGQLQDPSLSGLICCSLHDFSVP